MAQSIRCRIGPHARQPGIENKCTRQIATIYPRIDVVPDRSRLNERAGERGLIGDLSDELDETERAGEPARPLTLGAERFARRQIGFDDGSRDLRPRLSIDRRRTVGSALSYREQSRRLSTFG